MTKRSAFAFIRYKLPDVGIRAVAGEVKLFFYYPSRCSPLAIQHNQPHDGHQIRVQLRENNPKGSPYKFVRGRIRAPLNAGAESEVGTLTAHSQSSSEVSRGADDMSYLQNRPNMQDPTSSVQRAIGVDSTNGPPAFTPFALPTAAHNLPSPDTPSVSKERTVVYNPIRANSTSTTDSMSPSPSTTSHQRTSMATAIPQYTFPIAMGYYPNQQWMQAYPAYPYAFPFIPPGYMHCPQAPYPSTQDGTPYPSGPSTGWPSSNDVHKVSDVVHARTAYVVIDVGCDAAQPSVANREQSPQHSTYPQSSTQPPLRPTGFMQGEQGTLIPMYQPDALNRYMSAGTRQSDTPPIQNPSQQHAAVWPQYPQIPMHPYIYHPSSMVPPTSHHLAMPTGTSSQGTAWTPGPTPVPYGTHPTQYQAPPQSHGPPPTAAPPPAATPTFRHSVAGTGSLPPQQYPFRQMPGTPSRRYQRRELQYGHKQGGFRDPSARIYKADDGVFEHQSDNTSQRHGAAARPASCAFPSQSQ